MPAVEVGGNGQPRLRFRRTNEAQDLLIAVERFAGPVFGDFRKEAVFNGIPLGSTGRVVGDRECQAMRVRQLRLEFGFPRSAATAITTAGVTQNEELPGSRITFHPFGDPPTRNGMGSEGRCVVRDPHHDRASVRQQIINAVRDRDAGGVGAEVVIVDQTGGQIPACAWIAEVANQFTLFGIHADDGQTMPLKPLAQIGEVEKLLIAMWAEISRNLLVIHTQGVSHRMEEAGDGIGADDDTEVCQRHGNLVGSSPGPLPPSDGIAGRVVFEQELD